MDAKSTPAYSSDLHFLSTIKNYSYLYYQTKSSSINLFQYGLCISRIGLWDKKTGLGTGFIVQECFVVFWLVWQVWWPFLIVLNNSGFFFFFCGWQVDRLMAVDNSFDWKLGKFGTKCSLLIKEECQLNEISSLSTTPSRTTTLLQSNDTYGEGCKWKSKLHNSKNGVSH